MLGNVLGGDRGDDRLPALGPIEVSLNGRALEIGGQKQRALLAILVLSENKPVSRDVLADRLWREHPPAGAQHTLDVYISRLRKALEPAAGCQVVVTRPGAYLLRAPKEQIDICRFERLARAGRHALAENMPGRAAADFHEALSLWRGAPLADLSGERFAQAEIARLEELRAGVIEDRIDADLALGHHREIVSELEALVASYPLRERLHQQLMITLYRCGRQAEALAAYRSARRMLVEELGIEPSRGLKLVERAILAQDVCLEPPARVEEPQPIAPRGNRRSRPVAVIRRTQLLTAAGASMAVVLAMLASSTFRRPAGPGPVAAGPDTVAVIDGAHNVMTGVVIGAGRPDGVAYGAGAAWITDSADDLLLRVDSANQVIDRIPVGRGPAGVTVAGGEVWVANEFDGTVSEINPVAGSVVATIQVGNGPDAWRPATGRSGSAT